MGASSSETEVTEQNALALFEPPWLQALGQKLLACHSELVLHLWSKLLGEEP